MDEVGISLHLNIVVNLYCRTIRTIFNSLLMVARFSAVLLKVIADKTNTPLLRTQSTMMPKITMVEVEWVEQLKSDIPLSIKSS